MNIKFNDKRVDGVITTFLLFTSQVHFYYLFIFYIFIITVFFIIFCHTLLQQYLHHTTAFSCNYRKVFVDDVIYGWKRIAPLSNITRPFKCVSEVIFPRGCSPVSLLDIFRKALQQNTSGGLPLEHITLSLCIRVKEYEKHFSF